MSLDFPNSPVAGTVFGAWRYDGTKWGAVSGVSGGGSAGDITAVLAGTGLSGGGTEGDVSIALAVPVTVARGGTGATDAAAARTNLGAAPLDQGVTLTGDVSGSGAQNASVATTLATVNANVGTFQGLTVNAKGLVTAAANQSYLTSPVTLTTQVTGVLPIANGGSGSGTAAAAPWLVKTGKTDGSNAAAGEVGEYNATTMGPTSITSGALAAIASLTLAAGDWDVWGHMMISPSTATVSNMYAGVNTSNASLGTFPSYLSTAANNMGVAAQHLTGFRVSSASSSTIYGMVQSTFGGTCTATCSLFARRVR